MPREDFFKFFMDSLRSSYTKRAYAIFFRKYLEFMGMNVKVCKNEVKLIEQTIIEFMGSQDIMFGNDPKVIEKKIIEFIMHLRGKGLSHSAIRNYMMAIISFYKINDIVLNTAKISKFLPEFKRMRKDRAYKHEEISKLLEIADERMRAVILILASTGIRIGALIELKVRDIQDNKLTVYDGTKDEYYTFVSPECKEAIDSYLDMRSRYGEKLTDDSPLIREQFDVRVSASKARHVDETTLYGKLRDLSRRSGVRDKNLPICHGFRKFFTTQLINSKVKTEARLSLEGHSNGITDHYYRPSDEERFQEYQKAIDNLTISEENKLRTENQELKRERTNYDFLNEKIESIQSGLVKVMNMATMNKTPEEVQELYKSFQAKLKNDQ